MPEEVARSNEGNPPVPAAIIQSAEFSGPLPPPSLLRAYEQVCPGFAERIVKMAEVEQAHRHGTEKRDQLALSNIIGIRKIGQFCGFTLGFVGISGGILLCAMNRSSGFHTIVLSLGTLLSVYVASAWRERNQRKNKDGSSQAELPPE